MIAKRTEFKLALIRKFGTQIAASVETGVSQSTLSVLQQGLREPNEQDIKKLGAHFSARELRKFFGKKVVGKLESEKAAAR